MSAIHGVVCGLVCFFCMLLLGVYALGAVFIQGCRRRPQTEEEASDRYGIQH